MTYIKTSISPFHIAVRGPEVIELDNGTPIACACGQHIPANACAVLVTCNFELEGRRVCTSCRLAHCDAKSSHSLHSTLSQLKHDYSQRTWLGRLWARITGG